MTLRSACVLALACGLLACLLAPAAAAPELITLQNDKLKVVFLTTGATIQKLFVPDCKNPGKQIDVALGYDNITQYEADPHPSFGAIVGRVANRISPASFNLDGKQFKLVPNDGNATIHGGEVRWSKAQWTPTKSADGRSITFAYTSKDGDSDFPGTVRTFVTYTLVGGSLNVSINATTDKPTPLNVIQHAYFNLKGAASNTTVLDTVLQINSRYYAPAPEGQLVPTGQVFDVRGSAYDFTAPKAIGKDVQKANGGPYKGYDLNYVSARPSKDDQQPVWWLPRTNPQVGRAAGTAPLTLAATATEPSSGLRMSVWTHSPGVHLYTGNFLGQSDSQAGPGKAGIMYPQYGGLCFEVQAFPNAINTPTFPVSVVRPGQEYHNRMAYEFSCTK